MELHEFMSADHERLDALLESAVRGDGTIDDGIWTQFRRGLLTHIGIEERILIPEVRARGGDLDLAERLHRDHAVLAALLVPPPTTREIEMVRAILHDHNRLEEGPGGFYEAVEALAGDGLVERARKVPLVPVAPYSDTPHLRRSIEMLLKKAGR